MEKTVDTRGEKHFLDTSVARPMLVGTRQYKAYFAAEFGDNLCYINQYVQMEFKRSYLSNAIAFYFILHLDTVPTIGDALRLWSNRFKGSELKAILQLAGDLFDSHRFELENPRDKQKAFFRAGRYQQLVLLNTEGNVVSRELSYALRAIQCSPDEPAQPLPSCYNSALMRAKQRFDEEVKLRCAQRDYTASLTRGQRYVLRELRVLFDATKEDDARADITLLEAAFRNALTTAVTKELNLLRRNGVTGEVLLGELKRIYFQYNLREFLTRLRQDENETSRIVCSSALV